MADKSNIEWTEQTWNPIVGCSILTPGCTNCYAMKMAARLQKMNRTGGSNSNYVNHYDGTTKSVNGNVVWTGKLAIAPDKIFLQPLSRKPPTTYFVNSMGDLFHEDCPDEWIDKVFAVMALAPQHTFQVLTKRADRMQYYMKLLYPRSHAVAKAAVHLGVWDDADGIYDNVEQSLHEPLPNVWLGVSTERQQEADERIPELLQTPAAIRFISAEPLLGPIDLIGTLARFQDGPIAKRQCAVPLGRQLIDWVIAGGESGHNARPMSIQWARELRDQCGSAGVPFFFKQFGEWRPAGSQPSGTPGRFAFGDYEHDRSLMIEVDSYPRRFTMFGSRSVMERVGKKAAGRLLDGIEHNDFPAERA